MSSQLVVRISSKKMATPAATTTATAAPATTAAPAATTATAATAKKTVPIPETILKKRKTLERLQAERAAKLLEQHKKKKGNT